MSFSIEHRARWSGFSWNGGRFFGVTPAVSAGTSRPFGGCWLRREPEAVGLLGPHRPPSIPLGASVAPELLRVLETETANDRPAARSALAKLKRGARVVVTGQQAGLLLGPLYTFHKALSAVAAAAALEEQHGRDVVAVFWVQDEDHDFDEMAELVWLDRTGALRQRRFVDAHPRVPVGDRTIPREVRVGVKELISSLSGTPFMDEAEALARPWLVMERWTDAFCANLAEAFKDLPLLILRGRSAAVIRRARDLYTRSLREIEALAGNLAQSTSEVEHSGFRVQVPLQPDRTLCFYQDGGPGAPRHRLTRIGPESFESPGGRHSLAELLKQLDTHPLRFSTSALFRPLVQDRLLPVVAQLAGPGEAAYLCQLSAVRSAWGVAKPTVSPRGRATWLEKSTRRRLRDLGATPADATGAAETFLAERAGRPELDAERLRSLLLHPLEQALAELGNLDPSLARARRRTEASLRRNVNRFVGQAARAAAQSDSVMAQRLAELRRVLLPLGRPQERCLGLTDLVARNGLDRLKSQFLESYVPFGTEAMELEL